jgi:ribose 5-phosphate isomerase A
MLEYVVRCVELIRVFSQVDYFVRSGMAVGLGTGLASSMAIRYMGEKLKDGSLREIVGVPM